MKIKKLRIMLESSAPDWGIDRKLELPSYSSLSITP
jgi:hypothetical protein